MKAPDSSVAMKMCNTLCDAICIEQELLNPWYKLTIVNQARSGFKILLWPLFFIEILAL